MWKSWRAASSESFSTSGSETSHRPTFSRFQDSSFQRGNITFLPVCPAGSAARNISRRPSVHLPTGEAMIQPLLQQVSDASSCGISQYQKRSIKCHNTYDKGRVKVTRALKHSLAFFKHFTWQFSVNESKITTVNIPQTLLQLKCEAKVKRTKVFKEYKSILGISSIGDRRL